MQPLEIPDMPTKLPINVQDLLRQRTVEGERTEYKAGWNPAVILRTVLKVMAGNSSPALVFKSAARL
jgi:hypothetical protein